jgi:hypothetical protein
MLHYYKQNYPRPPYQEVTLPVKVQATVLQIHGMQDPFLLPGGLKHEQNRLQQQIFMSQMLMAGRQTVLESLIRLQSLGVKDEEIQGMASLIDSRCTITHRLPFYILSYTVGD